MIEYYLPDFELKIIDFTLKYKNFSWKQEDIRWYFYNNGLKTPFYLKLLNNEIEFHCSDKTIITTFKTKKEAKKEILKIVGIATI
jgi:hypothetical protein